MNNNSILNNLILSLPSVTLVFEILVIIISIYFKKFNILFITLLLLISKIFYLFYNIYETNIFISIFIPFIFCLLLSLKKQYDTIKSLISILTIFILYIILATILIHNTNFILAVSNNFLEQSLFISDLFLVLFIIFFLYLCFIRLFIKFENIIFIIYFLSMFEFVFYTLFEKSYTTYFEFASLFLLIFFCIDGYKLIFYDSLTKLLNRRAFDKAIITKNDIICLIGVDCFKNINEKYGIDAGDFVLKKLASVLKDNYKQIYRFGGDEFIIIFNNIEFKDCILELDNIRKVISNYDFSFGKNKIKLTISVGLSQVFDDKFSALKKANEYLYTAKSNGRNRVIYGK